jgi:carbohydrate-selective porin OprB
MKQKVMVGLAAFGLAWGFPLGLRAEQRSTISEPKASALEAWWDGKYASGNWFGLRDTLEDYGLNLSGGYRGAFFGVVDSERGSRGFYDQELVFVGRLEFAKLLKVEVLEGLSGFGEVRWRDARPDSNPNTFVQASSNFQLTNWQSGTQWRLMTFGLEYETPELFGIKQFATLNGGWLRPQKEFIDQPLSKLFVNNAFCSSKGIGANIPFSSSFSTWGGTLKIKPVNWYYLKGGIFMAYPSATDSTNHGLAFQGFAQDPSQNGLMFMGETGFTPKWGPSQLPGKYVLGGYYFGNQKNSFNGTVNWGQYGFYWQLDQMLYREPSREEPAPVAKGPSDGKSVASGKSFKAPVSVTSKPKLNDQGLSVFSLFTFSPNYNNILPFYFHVGLVYKGLIPYRDKDQLMFAVGYGQYSFENIQSLQARGNPNQPNYTVVLEWDYRIQINDWAYFQPFIQYLIQPNGTGAVANATALGFQYGVVF